MWDLIEVAKRTEVNALVIDVKDDRGFVLYHSTVPLAREIGADTTRPMSYRRVRAVLDSMRTYGIYPIARIVVAKDPLLAEHKLEWSIKRRSDPAKPWLDKNGKPWLDPHQRGVWQYAADLAKEAVNLGFSEVQFDYVRFPDEKRLVSEATFPLANGRIRAQVIREQLGFTRGALRVDRGPDDDRRVRPDGHRHDGHGNRPAVGEIRRPGGRRAAHGLPVPLRAGNVQAGEP